MAGRPDADLRGEEADPLCRMLPELRRGSGGQVRRLPALRLQRPAAAGRLGRLRRAKGSRQSGSELPERHVRAAAAVARGAPGHRRRLLSMAHEALRRGGRGPRVRRSCAHRGVPVGDLVHTGLPKRLQVSVDRSSVANRVAALTNLAGGSSVSGRRRRTELRLGRLTPFAPTYSPWTACAPGAHPANACPAGESCVVDDRDLDLLAACLHGFERVRHTLGSHWLVLPFRPPSVRSPNAYVTNDERLRWS